jgi:hypothetical protein
VGPDVQSTHGPVPVSILYVIDAIKGCEKKLSYSSGLPTKGIFPLKTQIKGFFGALGNEGIFRGISEVRSERVVT